jgi:DNA-directed RNA polymerase specialized sigma24 family protein
MLSKEDIEQQAWLYLTEMWEHYVDTYKHNQVARFVFYDYVRFNLIKYMTSWVANQIHINVADYKAPNADGVIHMEETDELHMDLGWVILKSDSSFLSDLTVRQKYLIFLRYVKQMSILEISKLTQRNHKSIEKDFTLITRTIKAGDFYEHPSKSN